LTGLLAAPEAIGEFNNVHPGLLVGLGCFRFSGGGVAGLALF
jgi:hypothetical protein